MAYRFRMQANVLGSDCQAYDLTAALAGTLHNTLNACPVLTVHK